MREHFRITASAEAMTSFLQLGLKLAVVVDLAVEDGPDRAVLVGHRLVTGGREVDDAEPRVQEGCLRPSLRGASVRAAMTKRLEHALAHDRVEPFLAKRACDAAHVRQPRL